MAEKLSDEAIEQQLNELQGWTIENGKLHKEFSFDDFAQALAFVNEVGAVAEELDHHPEMWFTYGKAVVEIITHDAGGITEKDVELAARL